MKSLGKLSVLAALFLALAIPAFAQNAKTLVWGFAPGPYSDLFKTAIQPALEKKATKS